MQSRVGSGLLLAFCLSLICVFQPVLGYSDSDLAPVSVGSSQLFSIAGSRYLTARARALEINNKIRRIIDDKGLDAHKIDTIIEAGGNPSVVLGETRIVTVSDQDQKVFGESKQYLAQKWASVLRARLTQLEPIYEKTESARKASDSDTKSKPLSEHRVLLFLLQVALLLSMACICGEIMTRFKQPAVIGQLMAGIILGPSVLGAFAPGLFMTLFPPENTQGYLLDIVSWLGVIFLLMLTGTETDIQLIKSQGKPALATSVGGIVLPFLLGLGVGYMLPETMLVLPNQRLILGAFLGTVFSMSSVAIIAKVLIDMKLMRRNVGQIILASALAQDVVGCVILAIVAAFATASSAGLGDLLKVPIGMVLFVGIGGTIGRKLILDALRWIHDSVSIDFALISFVAILLLVSSAITQFIGVHVVLGAFAVGVIIAQSPLTGEKVLHPLEAVTMGIFAPIFFAAAGLHVNLTILREFDLLMITFLVTFAACLGKIGGSVLGGYFVKMNVWESLSVGFGTNARGAMGLIVGILGFSLGILTVNMFSIIVIMSLATTAMTPFLLNRSLPRVPFRDDEKERLDREEAQSKSFVATINRVLVPIRPGSSRQLSSKLIGALGEDHAIEATALTLLPERSSLEAYHSQTLKAASKEGNVTLINRMAQNDDMAFEILQEANKKYDLLVLAPGQLETGQTLDDPLIGNVVKNSPCPVLIVCDSKEKPHWDIKRILIPTSAGGQTSKTVQLGILIAKAAGAKVTAVSVVEDKRNYSTTMLADDFHRALVAQELVDQVAVLAAAYEVEVETRVLSASNPSSEIVKTANELEIDLIVVGANLRPTRQLHMGGTVHELMARARCHLAIFSA